MCGGDISDELCALKVCAGPYFVAEDGDPCAGELLLSRPSSASFLPCVLRDFTFFFFDPWLLFGEVRGLQELQ